MTTAPASAPAPRRRLAGVTVPLFSLRSEGGWGIGEIGDLPAFAGWLAAAGIKLVQVLPLGEISGAETSPYAALTAFGIDPMYVSLADVEDASREPGVPDPAPDPALQAARAAPGVDYATVRALKRRALAAAHGRFRAARAEGRIDARAARFEAFREDAAEWLADYALFRALKDAHGDAAWWDWPAPLRDRDGAALAAARARHATAVEFHEYVQWLAHAQWAAARAELRALGVEVMGDLPFMVGRDSADVWADRGEFRDDASVGAPPDAFDAEGQEWGLPPYRWEAMRANGFRWLRRRARYSGSLYDRFRVDHLVGFFRTYTRPREGLRDTHGKLVAGSFDPAAEPAQDAHGREVVGAMVAAAREAGAEIVAEDLGVIPDFVRAALVDLGVPGYKVLIWEKDYKTEGTPFLDPRSYPARSVACFATHDTDPVAVWWETRDAVEREAVKELSGLRERADELGAEFTPAVHQALLDLICHAGSDLVLLLAQDVLGTRDRINVPATTGPQNWTWRLPGTVAELRRDPAVAAALDRVRASTVSSGRG